MKTESTPRKRSPKAPASRLDSYAKVDVREFAVADLKDAPYNARSITTDALRGLAASIERFGLISLPVVNVRDGINRIVGGHQRVRTLRESGEETVRCIVVEFDEATERRANLALNNRAIQGEFVPELTRELLSQLRDVSDDSSVFTDLRLTALYKDALKSLRTVEGVDDVVSAGKAEDDHVPGLGRAAPASSLGVVYALGPHRIYCGKLVAPGTLSALGVGKADAAVCQFTNMADRALDVYLAHVLQNVVGSVHLVAETANHLAVEAAFSALGGHVSSTVVAYDPTANGKSAIPYFDAVIPIIYGWADGTPRPWFGNRDQGNAWPLKSKLPKDDVPVEILVRAIQNTTKAGDVVLDVNVRKGATLVAAEKTGRRLVGYVATAREMDAVRARWTAFVHGVGANWKAATKEA